MWLVMPHHHNCNVITWRATLLYHGHISIYISNQSIFWSANNRQLIKIYSECLHCRKTAKSIMPTASTYSSTSTLNFVCAYIVCGNIYFSLSKQPVPGNEQILQPTQIYIIYTLYLRTVVGILVSRLLVTSRMLYLEQYTHFGVHIMYLSCWIYANVQMSTYWLLHLNFVGMNACPSLAWGRLEVSPWPKRNHVLYRTF